MGNPSLQQKRHRDVLTDLVRAYIETGEPVSSRSIARRHAEPLSSATVRNVMADLEDEGYLYQPHTSAGRVPTAAAYRFFVEEVAARATARPQEMEAIRRELELAATPEAVMERASRILADVSRGLGIIVAPPLARTPACSSIMCKTTCRKPVRFGGPVRVLISLRGTTPCRPPDCKPVPAMAK